jgi:hypothetical protein
MSEITRRGFLQRSGKAAVGLGLGSIMAGVFTRAEVSANDRPGDDEAKDNVDSGTGSGRALRVPMEVKRPPTWLSWVGATTGCLNALGIDCDTVDVAGHSGYAFMMTVPKELHPSGPTDLDWGLLLPGVRGLGRSTRVFRGAHCACELEEAKDEDHKKRIRDELRKAYDFVSREIEAGRPCVIWGTYAPEFGIAVGVEDDRYLVASEESDSGEPQPPIPFDGLISPGGTYVLAFPSPVRVVRIDADRNAVSQALDRLNHRTTPYDNWIAALEAGKADVFGNSFNAQCWAEAKRFARDFVQRLAKRNQPVAGPLNDAAAAYVKVAEAMDRVAQLFPIDDPKENVKDRAIRMQAMNALRVAKGAEVRAAEALTQAAAKWPQD